MATMLLLVEDEMAVTATSLLCRKIASHVLLAAEDPPVHPLTRVTAIERVKATADPLLRNRSILLIRRMTILPTLLEGFPAIVARTTSPLLHPRLVVSPCVMSL